MTDFLNFIVKENESGVKIKQYLKLNARLSGRLIRGAAKDGRISVNGQRVNLIYILNSGDIIRLNIIKKESQNIEPEPIDLDVVFEDNDIIVVNKQPGIVVHPTKNFATGTLANGLLYHFKENNEDCIVRLVSRLDMDTSGLILVAKNKFAHMALARDMKETCFQKCYTAVVHGKFTQKKGTIDLPIFRVGEGTIKRIIDERGQKSITHYEVIEEINGASILSLKLETGRTHQIRVHLNYIGHPVFGDTIYCEQDDSELISRQALHASKLIFPHPRTGKLIELQTALPLDIQKLISSIKKC